MGTITHTQTTILRYLLLRWRCALEIGFLEHRHRGHTVQMCPWVPSIPTPTPTASAQASGRRPQVVVPCVVTLRIRERRYVQYKLDLGDSVCAHRQGESASLMLAFKRGTAFAACKSCRPTRGTRSSVKGPGTRKLPRFPVLVSCSLFRVHTGGSKVGIKGSRRGSNCRPALGLILPRLYKSSPCFLVLSHT
ncbi:hypothetical protein L226DRAFT_172738 [Lentinus tigrinus ALCF2SS1-7]|uniref:uncharacterized protein n=1 Tax=Lentinus tigrinus ALCF2SS1-7 TaxID=1328758 RepID=UPI0011661A00|nr:hypothetical protein L226DRAFT_172738 [Lentinus tigrinus ALCF2SS1-7]